MDLQKRARDTVESHVLAQLEVTDDIPFFEVYIVWFAKTLQNWKALVSTTLPDQRYYELTYNGDRDELYLDVYQKWTNVKIENYEQHFLPKLNEVNENRPV